MPTNVAGFEITGVIEQKWLATGGSNSRLGSPVADEAVAFDSIGRLQQFENGTIVWHPDHGAWIVQGGIEARWQKLGGLRWAYPITDETAASDGTARFTGFKFMSQPEQPEASIYWTPANGAVEVVGAIRARWMALGCEQSALGCPRSAEKPAFDGIGRTQDFEGGTVAWHPELGAFAVCGPIAERWSQLGGPQWAYPTTDQATAADGVAQYNHFRNMRATQTPEASIYWTPLAGCVEVIGGIRAKWSGLDFERSPLKYPLAPEKPTFDGTGRIQEFESGTLVWHPQLGTFAVLGAIAERWRQLGGTQWAYPISDETPTADGIARFNHFRGMHLPMKPESSIFWTPTGGAVEIYGGIRARWAALGWERSALGCPTASEIDRPGGGRLQSFEHGVIEWSPGSEAQERLSSAAD